MKTTEYLPEGIKILIASAGAYLGAYLYQVGYAGYFGIPREFITVSTPNLLLFGATLTVFVVLIFQVLSMFVTIHDEHGEVIAKSAFGLLLKKWGIAALIGLSLWYFSGYGIDEIWRLWYLIVFVSIDLVLPMFRPNGTSYDAALRDWIALDFKPKDAKPNSIFTKPETKKLIFFLCLFVLAALYCVAFGRGEARRRSEFGFIGKEAVIARYDDQLVLCEYDAKASQFLPRFRLQEITSEEQVIDVKKISRIK